MEMISTSALLKDHTQRRIEHNQLKGENQNKCIDCQNVQ